MIENVLAKDINALEPRLTRQGYNAKVFAELLNAKPREIKSFLSGQLASGRTQELQSELLAAGNPALAVLINVGPARMLSVCSQSMWFHSHVMWF
jgi:hypothetical protein